MTRKIIYFASLVTLLIGCANRVYNSGTPADTKKDRIIYFAGYEWIVDDSGSKKKGPGPNFFSSSEENVWVDTLGHLHLRITHNNDKWNCAKITLVKSYGYNKYVFSVSSRIDSIDKNVVVGLFTYLNDYEEIDIEFSKWGDSTKLNSQYAIQPSHKSENKERYNIDYNDNYTTIHTIDWQADKINFLSIFDSSSNTPGISDTIHSWSYFGDDIPADKDERIKINLWLFRGIPPTDQLNNEIIIKDFKIM